ncbi:MAG: tetratricopeptide repeat protein [Myxococcota bacterium]
MTGGLRMLVAAMPALMALPGAARADVDDLDLEEANQALTDWQLEDGFEAAKKLLAENPNDPEVWLLAARVQHHRGEHLSALALLDAVAESEDIDQKLLGDFEPLVRSVASYAAHFETRETPHFKIRYLNKDEIVAAYAEPILEAAYKNIAGDLGLLPAERGEKIVVEIFPDARGLAGATGLTIQQIETSGTIAVCKFHRLMIISPLATANGYDWGNTIAHEFAHLVISKKSHNTIPIWLHEGIAKFYESRWKGKRGQALSPYGEKLLGEAVRQRDYVTFDEMHPSMALLPSQEKAALAFAEVFTVIEFLNERYGAQAVPKLLDEAATGKSLERVLRSVFGTGLKGVESSWKRYLERREFRKVPGAAPKRIRLATSEKEAQAGKPLEHIEDRQVHDHSRLGELLHLRGHPKAAIIEYEKAYARAGVQYATLINRLARAYTEDHRVGDALTVLGKLFVAHPGDGDAHLLAGRIHFKQKNYAEAKRHFEAVRLRNPFNPEIHLALASLYEVEKKPRAAERERRFLKLSRKPRPTRTYELPPPPAGNARVSIVTTDWTAVRIDGELPITTPLWKRPIEAGAHSVEYLDDKGRSKLHNFTLEPGADEILVLD